MACGGRHPGVLFVARSVRRGSYSDDGVARVRTIESCQCRRGVGDTLTERVRLDDLDPRTKPEEVAARLVLNVEDHPKGCPTVRPDGAGLFDASIPARARHGRQ